MARRLGAVALVGVVSLVGAAAASAGAASNAGSVEDKKVTLKGVPEGRNGQLNKIVNTANFGGDTWNPTAANPLPFFESPVVFNIKDDASYWFDTELKEAEKFLYTRSASASAGPTSVKFLLNRPNIETAHTVTAILWPEGAPNQPINSPGAIEGEFAVDLVTPGLYAWNCTIHPYMAGAHVIDDPTTPGADLGRKLHWIDGKVYGSAADEVFRVVRLFFTLTGPLNWQHYEKDRDVAHDPSYPKAPIMTFKEDGSPFFIPNLDTFFQERYKEGTILKAPVAPKAPGVGKFYADMQWEMSKSKTKPGAVAVFNAETWDMDHKWFGPSIDLNNPHNQWSSVDGSKVFVTNWYGTTLATLDTRDGSVLYETEIGPSPSHVVTRSNTETLIIPNNGGGRVSEVSKDGKQVIKTHATQPEGSTPALPHGHWVSGNGKYALTPNAYRNTMGLINLEKSTVIEPPAGVGPVAAMFSGDSKRAYMTNLLSSDMLCVSTEEPACPNGKGSIVHSSTVDFRQNYNPITGEATGPWGLLPIQLPISPDDKYMFIVMTGTAQMMVMDLDDHRLVKTLPCGPGCHGGNFGLKKGGGWYVYITVKYANIVNVYDGDPNNDGDPSDAKIVGTLLTNAAPGTQVDDAPRNDYTLGQGGNGLENYPTPLQGWVQTMPKKWQDKMTCQQRQPLKKAVC